MSVHGTLSAGGGFSRVEQTLLEGGRGAAVIHQRMEFQDLMRERFEAVIDRPAGDRVDERQPAAPRHDVRGVDPGARPISSTSPSWRTGPPAA
jgi:hypothetical protein